MSTSRRRGSSPTKPASTSWRSRRIRSRPSCKILDYGKYKFQAQKKAAEARKKQKTVEVKEIKMRPNIDIHDYDAKMKAARRFLDEGDKVKMTLRFRGREMAHQELGLQLLFRVRDDLTPMAKVEVRAAARRPPDDHDPGADAEGARSSAGGGAGLTGRLRPGMISGFT